MSSESSTNARRAPRDAGFTPRHLFLLLAMAGATWAVVTARDTHPVALLLLSAAVVAAGLTGAALHEALIGFLTGRAGKPAELSHSDRNALENEKALVLRSIKELEFDRGMGKLSDADVEEIGGRLRARALALMEALDQLAGGDWSPGQDPRHRATAGESEAEPEAAPGRFCAQCGSPREPEARFCKHCGARLT